MNLRAAFLVALLVPVAAAIAEPPAAQRPAAHPGTLAPKAAEPRPTVDGRAPPRQRQVQDTLTPGAAKPRPTVDGRAPPRQRQANEPGIWTIGSTTRIAPRRFRDWGAFSEFAERRMHARAIRDRQGNLVAITGRYRRAGDALLEDARGKLPDNPDFIAAFLGGRDGRLRVGDRYVAFPGPGTKPKVSRLTSTQTCVGDDCISGKSWLTHAVVYHSAGSRTRQTAGGNRVRRRACCRSGELIRTSEGAQCRLKRRGAWAYDRQFGRLLPTGPDPYVFTPSQSCESEVLSNQLTVRARLLFGPSQSRVLEKVATNTREVEVGEWLLAVRLDLETQSIDNVSGVCGFHSSSLGGFAETRDGFTGDDDVLCR